MPRDLLHLQAQRPDDVDLFVSRLPLVDRRSSADVVVTAEANDVISPLADIALTKRVNIVAFGAEGDGVRQRLRSAPLAKSFFVAGGGGALDSLNVGVFAGIVLHHMRAQLDRLDDAKTK